MLIRLIQRLLPEEIGHFSDGPKRARLRRKLNVDNAIRLLVLSDLYQAHDLKEKAIVFINDNAASVMKQPEWKELIKSHAHLIADLYRKMADVDIEED